MPIFWCRGSGLRSMFCVVSFIKLTNQEFSVLAQQIVIAFGSLIDICSTLHIRDIFIYANILVFIYQHFGTLHYFCYCQQKVVYLIHNSSSYTLYEMIFFSSCDPYGIWLIKCVGNDIYNVIGMKQKQNKNNCCNEKLRIFYKQWLWLDIIVWTIVLYYLSCTYC